MINGRMMYCNRQASDFEGWGKLKTVFCLDLPQNEWVLNEIEKRIKLYLKALDKDSYYTEELNQSNCRFEQCTPRVDDWTFGLSFQKKYLSIYYESQSETLRIIDHLIIRKKNKWEWPLFIPTEVLVI